MNTNDEQAPYGLWPREVIDLNTGERIPVEKIPATGTEVDHNEGTECGWTHSFTATIPPNDMDTPTERAPLLEWIRQRIAEEEDLGNRADTTNMAAPHDWKAEAFKEVLAELERALTNDAQAPYGKDVTKYPIKVSYTSGPPDNPSEREPVLTNAEIREWNVEYCGQAKIDECRGFHPYTAGAINARSIYEAKIASGELRVVNRVGVELVPNDYDCQLTCTGCGDGAPYYLLEEFDDMNFCPNCGAQIAP